MVPGAACGSSRAATRSASPARAWLSLPCPVSSTKPASPPKRMSQRIVRAQQPLAQVQGRQHHLARIGVDQQRGIAVGRTGDREVAAGLGHGLGEEAREAGAGDRVLEDRPGPAHIALEHELRLARRAPGPVGADHVELVEMAEIVGVVAADQAGRGRGGSGSARRRAGRRCGRAAPRRDSGNTGPARRSRGACRHSPGARS